MKTKCSGTQRRSTINLGYEHSKELLELQIKKVWTYTYISLYFKVLSPCCQS